MNNQFIISVNGMVLVEADVLYEMVKAHQTLDVEWLGKSRMEFWWSRYTMDGMGYHIGYEDWKVRIPLIEKNRLGWLGSPRCVWGNHLAALKSDDAKCILVNRPNIIRGEDGYYPPDTDFGWEEFEALIDPIIREINCGEGNWNSEERSWSIKTPVREIIMGDLDHNLEANRDRRYVKK